MSHYNMAYSQSTMKLKSKMAAYFNVNNNEISKDLLINKFNIILDNQSRLLLNNQKSVRHRMNHRDLLGLFRSSHRRCCLKKGVLKNFANFAGKHMCWSLLQACNFSKKTETLVFSCEIWEIFKNIYFEENLRKTAYICFTSRYYSK